METTLLIFIDAKIGKICLQSSKLLRKFAAAKQKTYRLWRFAT